VDSLTLLILEFSNSGNLEIEEKDYNTPISVDFGDSAEILSAKVLEQFPGDLDIKLNNDKSLIKIKESLMNQGDYFRIHVLVSQYHHYSVQGRIAGVPRITKVDNYLDTIRVEIMKIQITFGILFVSLILVFLIAFDMNKILFSIFSIVGLILSYISVYYRSK
jgi:hypothetical protein